MKLTDTLLASRIGINFQLRRPKGRVDEAANKNSKGPEEPMSASPLNRLKMYVTEREGNVLGLQYIGYQILGGLRGLRSRIWQMAKNVGDFSG
jgi:hypothetical protein